MKKPSLIILAAGMGSRYEGLKQIDPLTKEGDTFIDFSIYDAIDAGFGKIVFIIRESLLTYFKETFEKRWSNRIEINFVFQEIKSLPQKYMNEKRIKPWGTGHAVLTAKNYINENFSVINADDFYGRDAFHSMANLLTTREIKSTNFGMIAYELSNTASDHGYVSRGECTVGKNGYLERVCERTQIEKRDNGYIFQNNNGEIIDIEGNTPVSMNFWGFTPTFFDLTKNSFDNFLEKNYTDLNAEFHLPYLINSLLRKNEIKVEVKKSRSQWFGVTYKNDKTTAEKAMDKLKSENKYPTKLW